MGTFKPNLETKQSIDNLTQTLIAELPTQLGIDEIIPGCEVINADTYATGLGPPRYITVALGGNEYVPVLWRGGVPVTVGLFVTVLHYRNGNLYEVLGAGGVAGTIANNTLDQAYDEGGAGAGRTITADTGTVYIAGTDGLQVDNTADIQELRVYDDTELTLDAAGAITRVQTYHSLDTFGGAATDDLVTINGGADGDILIIHPEDDARTIVIKHNTGNIWLIGLADISLTDAEDHIMLIYDLTNTRWCSVGDGGGAGGVGVAGEWTALAGAALDFEPDLPAVIDAAGTVTEYATIQLAITGAAAGEAVVIPPGTYDESITLKAGVWVGELVSGTVIINSTSANTAVICADNGYLKVKEINVTRDDVANCIGIYAGAALAADCIIICEEISVVNINNGVAAGARGIFVDAATGSLFVKADLMHVLSERFTYGLYGDGGSADITLEIARADVTSVQEQGAGIFTGGTFGGSLRVSNAYWITTGGTSAAPVYGVYANDCSDLRMSDCQFFAISASAGQAVGIYLNDDITAYLYDCVFSGTSTVAGAVYGIYSGNADVLCEARNTQFSATSSGTGGCYAVRISAGRIDLWHCTTDTSTAGVYYDLRRTGGILSIYSVTNYATSGEIYFSGHTGINLYAIAAGAITVIPDSIGDVAAILTIIYAVSESAGGVSGGTATVVPAGSVVLYNDGTDVLTLAVAANGAVTLQRTAGAATFDVSINMVWI